MTIPANPDPDQKRSPKKNFMKYASLGYEMAALLLIAVFLGKYLDKYFNNDQQYFTAGLVISFMGAYMYKLIKDLSKGH